MQVETAQSRRIEDRFGQDQAIGDDHGGIQVEGGECFLLRRVAQRHRRAHRDLVLERQRMDRRGLGLKAATLGTRRLRIDAGDVVTGGDQLGERRHREIGCA